MTGARRILVTGANSGLGRAIAHLLHRLGHQVALSGRDPERLEAAAWPGALLLPADLSRPEAASRLAERAIESLGGLDAVINNAGRLDPMGPLEGADPAAWAQTITINLVAPALIARGAIAALRASRGRLVQISTGAAIKATSGWSAYCASKAGLHHLTSVLALEEPEIACFSLRPGVVDTPMQERIRQSAEAMRPEDHQRFLELHRQGALEPPEVPARAAVWLALFGPASRSGQLIDYRDPEVAAGAAQLEVL